MIRPHPRSLSAAGRQIFKITLSAVFAASCKSPPFAIQSVQQSGVPCLARSSVHDGPLIKSSRSNASQCGRTQVNTFGSPATARAASVSKVRISSTSSARHAYTGVESPSSPPWLPPQLRFLSASTHRGYLKSDRRIAITTPGTPRRFPHPTHARPAPTASPAASYRSHRGSRTFPASCARVRLIFSSTTKAAAGSGRAAPLVPRHPDSLRREHLRQ